MILIFRAGVKRFYDNLEMMLGFRINPYMAVSWTVLSPIFCMVRIIKFGVKGSGWGVTKSRIHVHNSFLAIFIDHCILAIY